MNGGKKTESIIFLDMMKVGEYITGVEYKKLLKMKALLHYV